MNPSDLDALSGAAMRWAGLQVPIRPWERADQLPQGNWWIEAIGRITSSDLCGTPIWGARPRPVLAASACEVVLVASSTAYLIPMIVARTVLADGGELWHEWNDSWLAHSAEVLSLHRALGGSDDLAALLGLLSDSALRERATSRDERRDAALAEIMSTLDPAPEQQSYRSYVQSLIDGPYHAPPDGLGWWLGSAASAAFAAADRDGVDAERTLSVCWQLLTWPASLGLCQSRFPEHIDAPGGGYAVDQLAEAGRRLVDHIDEVPEAWHSDPRFHAVRTLAGSRPSDAWHDYLRASEVFRDSADFESAWASLMSAVFWKYQHDLRGTIDTIRAAAEIAARAGWADTAEALRPLLSSEDTQ